MSKKSSVVARRAWNILRLALLWARKGGLFRNRLMLNFNLYVRKLLHSNVDARGALAYGDREFSFDDTPIIHVKMHRGSSSSLRFKMPHIPCIKPQVDFDYDFDYDDDDEDVKNDQDEMSSDHERRRLSFLKDVEEDEEEEETTKESCDDEEIDLKAEEFIARFYEQMKLQRQISYLQYN
ncbi:UNVERIFIED_CONTAM: hypothetical protein Slati_0601500 [Sesamum latifolium]|uniref:Cotton fiber protein n=1 Tax=Sesamum latifolium TaxID=2727402 RepID=A0AAW2Y227_9LAMI